MRKMIITAMCACSAMAAMAADTDIPGTNGVPDLTKGGELTRINKRWVGPVGIFCGSWRPRGQKMQDVRQLLVLEVEKGSPADGILEFGDVILGADGTGAKTVSPFAGAEWAMIPIADAITEAEAHDPALLSLLIWRPSIKPQAPSTDAKKKAPDPATDLDALDAGGGGKASAEDEGDDRAPTKSKKTAGAKVEGKVLTVTVKLEYLGRYADTAPYDCEKSKRILRRGIKTLYESDHCGSVGFEILCLLAADDPTHPDNAKYQAKAQEWAHKMILPPDVELKEGPGGGAWISGAQLIVLAEYYMKTKDEAVFPTLVKKAERHARGVSWFGTTGHRFADLKPDGSYGGRIGGYGPINCSGVLGFLGLSLARKAGVQSPEVDAAIERQRIYFGHHAFKGGIGYGEHFYGIGGARGDNNGKQAMAGFALGLQEGKEEEEKAKYFCGTTTLATYSLRQYAHGGSYFGQVWHPLGAAQGGAKAANLQFREIRWHLDLKRRCDGSRIYDSSGNSYGDFGATATALLFYALPLKQLYITGRGQKESLQFSEMEFNDLVTIKNFNASQASTQELLATLSRYNGMLRGAAGEELARRVKETPDSAEWPALIDQLLALAADGKTGPTGRTGACKALMDIKENNKTTTAALKNAEIAKTMAALLKDPDAYVRFGGIRVLQKLPPEDVRPHANEIMDAIIATGRPCFPLDKDDPLQAAHSVMGEVLFKNLLNKSMDGVDRKKLIPAIHSMLKTANADGRQAVSIVLPKLTKEEMLEIADVLVDNAIYPPPANAMSGTPAPAILAALGQHLFEETLPISALYDHANGSGVGMAIKSKVPQRFGKSALNRDFMAVLGDLTLVDGIDVNGVINEISKGAKPAELNKLKSIHSIKAVDPALTLPVAKTELMVDATNYAFPGENDTTYTWRKVYGPGKVAFTPNASGQSKKTTVEFTDRRPGKYRFEVTMSDKLGFNQITGTVDVTLNDKSGKLPANKPPQAKSQSLAAVPGLPVPVTLSGADPDGEDLGFVVTKQPAHGTLSGVGGDLIYTANFGYNGNDQFTFNAVDGQGETASGTIQFMVSDKDVGVAIYEGFDYPAGTVIGQTGGTSFGFSGPWRKSDGKDAKDSFLVDRGSLEKGGKDSSLSYPSLPATGGKLIKGERFRDCIRTLDPKVLAANKLLEHGRELWFSVFVEVGGGRFAFGLKGGETENAANLGFKIQSYAINATHNGEIAGTARNPWSRSANLKFPAKMPNMIIGRCLWGKTDKDPDTLEIYRVFDAPEFGPLVLKEPVCVLTEVIPQEKISTINLNTEIPVDEIRIGATLNSVMVGTKPLKVTSGE